MLKIVPWYSICLVDVLDLDVDFVEDAATVLLPLILCLFFLQILIILFFVATFIDALGSITFEAIAIRLFLRFERYFLFRLSGTSGRSSRF